MQLIEDMHVIQQAALQAADPANGLRQALRLESDTLYAGGAVWPLAAVERLLMVAVGKASVSMAQAAYEVMGERLHSGIVVTKDGHSAGHSLPAHLTVYEAAHPTPDAAGLQAAEAVARLLESAGAHDRVLALISGGASALLPLPPAGVSLHDLQTLTELLLRSGATIGELNTLRKHLDRLKGGGMLRLAAPAQLSALILSDVVGDPLDVIASGPSVPDPTSYSQAWAILERYGLLTETPMAIRSHLQAGIAGEVPETLKPGDPLLAHSHTTIIGSNRLAALAARKAAQRLGYHSLLLGTHLEGEAREVGRVAAGLARSLHTNGDPLPTPACLIWGGETTVTLRGHGRGGRNQELALAAALALDGQPGTALMALATDGSDGPTDAAGALVTGETLGGVRALGLDAHAALANNDAYPLLQAAGALLHTGPTGTNVNDLLVLLVSERLAGDQD